MQLFGILEMWCRKQAAAAILPVLLAGWLTGQSSQALTTFGKSNTQPPAREIQPTLPPARQCNRQSECAGTTGASCVRTRDDRVTRCLCADNQPPVNGQCDTQQTKALYHTCSNSDECNDGLICGAPNVTLGVPKHLTVLNSPHDTICKCDEENGVVERDYYCSDADVIKTSLFAIFVATCLKKLLSN